MITFTAEELKGVPEDVVSGYIKRTDDSGKEVYDVTYKTPDIFPIVCHMLVECILADWRSYLMFLVQIRGEPGNSSTSV